MGNQEFITLAGVRFAVKNYKNAELVKIARDMSKTLRAKGMDGSAEVVLEMCARLEKVKDDE